MRSRWNTEEAKEYQQQGPAGLRVYTSRLLGADSDLVLHGGGNTSVKAEFVDVFGQASQALYVKGSGWDLRTIEAPGFPPTALDYLLRLGQLPALSDSEMMRQLRLALLDPVAPTPSVEAILHGLIPHKYVDHTHADAVVTLSNTPNGEHILREIYGDEVLILPYIMPGFILAQQVAKAVEGLDWSQLRGIVLLHHGIFTFDEDARVSYENMIELVTKAEDYLAQHADGMALQSQEPADADLLSISRLRKSAGALFGGAVLVRLNYAEEAAGFAGLSNAGELLQRGPLTPDHTIHAKAFGAVLDDDPLAGLEAFAKCYEEYFRRHAGETHQMLDLMPRYAVWRQRGMVYFAGNCKRLQIVQDISAHTLKAIQQAEALGGWQALPQQDLFDVEYWELEQAKLASTSSRGEFEGKVALVTGGASGIGRASVEELLARGAVVAVLDVNTAAPDSNLRPDVLELICDVTDANQIQQALKQVVLHFGGIDLLVSNAGIFPASAPIAELNDEDWQQSIDINLSAHMKLLRACIPYLENGFDPAVVIVGSKNVPAPGPGAAAYSVAKAGLNQLGRVAALELGKLGIRVNSVHPNAVYDTAIWDDDVLASRAAHYGQTIEEYKTSNVLGTELTSSDVAQTVVGLLGAGFSKTTGAQIPVDGGNERVI